MLESYKERRAARHAAESAAKVDNSLPVMTPSMESIVAFEMAARIPRMSWIGAKMRPQSNGGRKCFSRHLSEHGKALKDNESFVPKTKAQTTSEPMVSQGSA